MKITAGEDFCSCVSQRSCPYESTLGNYILQLSWYILLNHSLCLTIVFWMQLLFNYVLFSSELINSVFLLFITKTILFNMIYFTFRRKPHSFVVFLDPWLMQLVKGLVECQWRQGCDGDQYLDIIRITKHARTGWEQLTLLLLLHSFFPVQSSGVYLTLFLFLVLLHFCLFILLLMELDAATEPFLLLILSSAGLKTSLIISDWLGNWLLLVINLAELWALLPGCGNSR